METILALIGPYYGLDWLTMLIGTSASYVFSERKLRLGFIMGIVACCCAMVVAVMSHQTGFIVYNALLISINIRGLLRGDRRISKREMPSNNNYSAEPIPVKIRSQI